MAADGFEGGILSKPVTLSYHDVGSANLDSLNQSGRSLGVCQKSNRTLTTRLTKRGYPKDTFGTASVSVPLMRLERMFLAPEANALSTEL